MSTLVIFKGFLIMMSPALVVIITAIIVVLVQGWKGGERK